jgi:hypothetical protein
MCLDDAPSGVLANGLDKEKRLRNPHVPLASPPESPAGFARIII